MDLKQFYFYIAIAEECNLSRAAEKLFISQSSLSRFLLKLEDTLKVRLFLRTKNNPLVITEEGKKLLDSCRKVVQEMEACADSISGQNTRDKKNIVLGVSALPALRKVTEIIPEFAKLHPEIRVEFVSFPINKLMDMLYEGELDLVRCACDEKNPAMNYITISHEALYLMVSSKHPLAHGREGGSEIPTVSLRELGDMPFILFTEGTTHRKVVRSYFDKIDFHPKHIIEASSSFSAVTYIEEGLAAGLLVGEYAEGNDKICALKIDPPLHFEGAFIYRKDAYLSKSEKDLIKLCLARK